MGKLEREKQRRKNRLKAEEKAREYDLKLASREDEDEDLDTVETTESGLEKLLEGKNIDPGVAEVMKKYWDEEYPVVNVAPVGPTSFQELDEVKEANKYADQVSELSWETRDLVRNIVNNYGMSPEEKGKAISKVGSDFSSRLKKGPEKVKKSTDMEILELQVILAKHNRDTGIVGKVGEWIGKSKASKLGEQYPVGDKSQVLYSISRVIRELESGVETARPQVEILKKAARDHGVVQFDEKKNAIIVEKDAKGQWRAVMFPSNNFLDRDGDIISDAAHREYVDWVNKNMDMAPVTTTWHEPSLVRKNQVDLVTYDYGFVMMSSILEEEEAAELLRAQLKTDLGMSHGSLVFERDEKDPRVILKYRTVEVSDLPLENAANPFTAFEVMSKEAHMDKQKYLADMLGEDRAKVYLEKMAGTQQELRDAGLEEKSTKEEKPAEPQSQTTVQTQVPTQPAAEKLPTIEEIVKAVRADIGVDELNKFLAPLVESSEKVNVLEGLVKNLLTSKEEALAAMINPPAAGLIWKNVTKPSEGSGNVLDESKPEDKKLQDATPSIPDDMWLSKQTNSTPLKQEAINV